MIKMEALWQGGQNYMILKVPSNQAILWLYDPIITALKNTVIEEEERQGKEELRRWAMTWMVMEGGKLWETKTEEEACYGRSHQMALLHVVLMVIFLGM